MDIYDKAIAHLTANPNEVSTAWKCPTEHPAGALFTQRGEFGKCLTQMKRWNNGHTPSYMPEDLFQGIVDDPDIPVDGDRIVLADLPAFAKHQRLLDDANVPLRVDEGWDPNLDLDPWVQSHPMFPKG